MGIEKFIRSVTVQTAIYWGNPTPSAFGGYVYDDPIEIKVRWEDKLQTIRAKDGREVVSLAELLVTQDLDLNGLVSLGFLSEIESNPELMSSALEISAFTKIPLFKKTDQFVRKAFLSHR